MFVAIVFACLSSGGGCQFSSATTYYPDEYGCRVEAFRIIEEIQTETNLKVVGGTCIKIDTKVL
jgi:hypothetical protein